MVPRYGLGETVGSNKVTSPQAQATELDRYITGLEEQIMRQEGLLTVLADKLVHVLYKDNGAIISGGNEEVQLPGVPLLFALYTLKNRIEQNSNRIQSIITNIGI